MDRRSFIRAAAVGTGGALTLGPDFWRQAFAAPAKPGTVYGALRPPDANGIMLPKGFTSRVLARAGLPVDATGYVWHPNPDGGAVFAQGDGGWIYVSNSEVPGAGGAGALVFDKTGKVVGAHRVLAGTNNNCAGGPTPWGTWLSCEEFEMGNVFECNPRGFNGRIRSLRAALGSFSHEAVTIDPDHRRLYLTEDERNGRFYRFTPTVWPDLRRGVLEAAVLKQVAGFNKADPRWTVTWKKIPRPNVLPGTTFTRQQVPETAAFDGGEGVWYDKDCVYFTTKGDNRVWMLNVVTSTMELLYDFKTASPNAPMKGVDNVIVNTAGEIFVAEDGGNMQIAVIDRARNIQPLLRVTGQDDSEITGPAFSPDGSRLYFSSQRGANVDPILGVVGQGITYEVRGPFRAKSFVPPAPKDGPLVELVKARLTQLGL